MSAVFAARYTTKCPGCGERIHEGDEATWLDGDVIHVDCPEPTDPLAVTREPCQTCWTVPTAAGTCLCEDDR